MGATLTTYDPAMKTLYDATLESLTYKRRPGIGTFKKYEKFGGKNKAIPVDYAKPQGRSAAFSDAQGNVTSTKFDDFLMTRVENHSLAHIDSQLAQASMSESRYAFVKALKHEVDGAFASLADNLETDFFRAGTKTLGRISSGSNVATDTVTLDNINDAVNFEVGMTLRASAADGGTLRTGEEVLEKVDRVSGDLTATSAAWNTVITAIAASDFLQVDGDGANGGSNLGLSGLSAWILTANPGDSDNHFGVNRSFDSRLYGTFHDGSAQLVSDALIDGQSICAQVHGGIIDCYLLNNVQFRKLSKELGPEKRYNDNQASGGKGAIAGIGYRGFVIHGDHGDIDVIAANKCQSTTAWGLYKDSWRFGSLGKLTRFDDTDGNTILRRGSASGVEARTVSWSNIWCDRPGDNVQVTLAA